MVLNKLQINMKKPYSINSILFIQDSLPCIRTIKIATVLSQMGLNLHLLYRGKINVGYKPNGIFKSINRLKKFNRNKIKQIESIIIDNLIDIIHYHNEPDILCSRIIEANFSVPVIYNQHDFLSPKRNMSKKDIFAEKTCNEEANGKIYITENYKELVNQKYEVGKNYFILPNLLLTKSIPHKKKTKFSKLDGKIHLVYVGLITQHENKIRNLITHFQSLSEKGFVIHVYPTRSKAYPMYESIKKVVMHPQLPIEELLEELTQYDFGILFLNIENVSEEKQNELKHGAWNKFYDYLSAGIPSITLSAYNYIEKQVRENFLGIVFPAVEKINSDSLSRFDYHEFENHLDRNRIKFSMESKANELILFHEKVRKKFLGNY